MKAKMLLSVLLLVFISLNTVYACLCVEEPVSFCEYLEAQPIQAIFQAKVVKHMEYTPENQAVYLEVFKKYKDDIQLTDTIKLYGLGVYSYLCDYHVFESFPLGDTVIGAFNISPGYDDIVNPDSLSENYWELHPNTCRTHFLSVKNGIVKGRIDDDITQFPYELFDSRLEDCNFSQKESLEVRCSEDNFSVFPNPLTEGKLTVSSDFLYTSIEQIRVFSADGRLVRSYENLEGKPYVEIQLDYFQKGINIIEIVCNGNKYYKKVVALL